MSCYFVFGANTDVGKTLVSALVCAQALRVGKKVTYLKPAQTGARQDSDAKTIFDSCGAHANLEARTLVALEKPVSPHLAARSENWKDNAFSDWLEKQAFSAEREGLCFVESAGGVASPFLDGALQCDFYRRFWRPAILVGDSKLGGISTTLAAYQMLKTRGFEIPLVVFVGNELGNKESVAEHIDLRSTSVLSLSAPHKTEALSEWITRQTTAVNLFDALVEFEYRKEMSNAELQKKALRDLWWPFTQHQYERKPLLLQSAFGEFFETAEGRLFDGSASWWTQGMPHADSRLAEAVAHAAGRFGHVLFPGMVHEPAARLAEMLLQSVGKQWASRVFYSDNGSTAVEVALKMALRYSEKKNSNSRTDESKPWAVLGLNGSYHGDTLGAMFAASPNAFNEKEIWYKPHGHWLDFPAWNFQRGCWTLQFPEQQESLQGDSCGASFQTLAEIFSLERDASQLQARYREYIETALNRSDVRWGCVLLEPLMHGSGGMHFVDPLFQRTLVQTARAHGIPIIFDEVFSGFWRLGALSAAQLLGVEPDIACYSKALTGGLCPLSVTLASAQIFDSFLGDSKLDALLHGHSYTAYPVGCAAAVAALESVFQTLPLHQPLSEFWCGYTVEKISYLPNVARCVSLGTVLAVELKSGDTGYASKSAQKLMDLLRLHGIHIRPLGNVVYLMSHPYTPQKVRDEVAERFLICLGLIKEESPE